MDLTKANDKQTCSFLASRIRSERIRQGYSQATMAETSGIPLRTYKRIELTGKGSIQNLILILRTFERIAALNLLFPSPEKSSRLTIIERVQMIAASKQLAQRDKMKQS